MPGTSTSIDPGAEADAGERYSRLHEELRRPARAMLRRAFHSAFCDDEIEDIYSSAWLGTLQALRKREDALTEEELRKYVLTAVANHASKELRRRGRRPTAPLDEARAVAASNTTPDERATDAEASRVTRDVLASLPQRRRTVMMLRYGWGLEPNEICSVMEGLSPRAYRREITRGVSELAERLQKVESGSWCEDREPVLRSYAAGLADAEETHQATTHLSHCRHCAELVGKLTGHLHDASGALVWTSAAGAIGEPMIGIGDRAAAAAERVGGAIDSLRERLPGGGADGGVEMTASQVAASGGTRGAGVAGAGVLTKLAGVGAAGKLALACVGVGAAAGACVATGIAPGAELLGAGEGEKFAGETRTPEPADGEPPLSFPPQIESPPTPGGTDTDDADGAEARKEEEPEGAEPTNAPAGSPAPTAPPEEHEFGLAGAANGTGGGSDSSGGGSGGGNGSGSGGGGGGSAVDKEFGP
jgi:RNA polymerase sigma factor (sigma-70 family)